MHLPPYDFRGKKVIHGAQEARLLITVSIDASVTSPAPAFKGAREDKYAAP